MKPIQDGINWNHIHLEERVERHPNPEVQYELMQEQDLIQKIANTEHVSLSEERKLYLQSHYAFQLGTVRAKIQQLTNT